MATKAGSGLLVAGCQAACGKTVVTTGLAGSLREEGFQTKAIKPVCMGTRYEAEAELAFISTISQTPLDYPVRFAGGAESFSSFHWAEVIRTATAGVEPVIVELPAAPAVPLRQDTGSGRWVDVGDLARELGLPCLLVAKEGPRALEELILNSTYLIAASLVNVIGLVTVETEPTETNGRHHLNHSPAYTRDERRAIALVERTGVPYLGCLRFSPSISVPRVNQGNLIKTTSAGLDLLPVMRSLNLRLSV